MSFRILRKWERGGHFRGSVWRHRRCCESKPAFPFTALTLLRRILCWKQARTDGSILIGCLCGLVLQSQQTVQAGAKIYNGEHEIGTITSCRFSPHADSAIALGYIRRDYLIPGRRVTIRHGEQSLAAMVSLLPIY